MGSGLAPNGGIEGRSGSMRGMSMSISMSIGRPARFRRSSWMISCRFFVTPRSIARRVERIRRTKGTRTIVRAGGPTAAGRGRPLGARAAATRAPPPPGAAPAPSGRARTRSAPPPPAPDSADSTPEAPPAAVRLSAAMSSRLGTSGSSGSKPVQSEGRAEAPRASSSSPLDGRPPPTVLPTPMARASNRSKPRASTAIRSRRERRWRTSVSVSPPRRSVGCFEVGAVRAWGAYPNPGDLAPVRAGRKERAERRRGGRRPIALRKSDRSSSHAGVGEKALRAFLARRPRQTRMTRMQTHAIGLPQTTPCWAITATRSPPSSLLRLRVLR